MALDADDEHATYDTEAVGTYFAAATQVALVLAAFRAPYRGRSTPVNAWWGSFDLAVNLFSGRDGRSPFGRLHHAQRDGRAGGRRRLVARRRALRRRRLLRLRAPRARGLRVRRRSRRRPRAGTGSSASTSSTGTTSAPTPTRTPPRWPSRARPSPTPAWSASGTPSCRRAPRGPRHRSSDPLARRVAAGRVASRRSWHPVYGSGGEPPATGSDTAARSRGRRGRPLRGSAPAWR